MPKLTYNLSTDDANRLIDAFGIDYQETITDEEGVEIPNPGTKIVFAKRRLAQLIINKVHKLEIREAERAMPSIDKITLTVE